MPAAISSSQKRYLRGLAHSLKPVILLGEKGVTPGVLAELDLALSHHELVKVRIPGEDRQVREAVVVELAEQTNAAVVQRIGHVATLYRRNPDAPQIALPR
ncbi:MAG: ribosome assembly RNA-binding protein YhbY [Lysobacteraceae bacterium]